jgi:hypothetical protein
MHAGKTFPLPLAVTKCTAAVLSLEYASPFRLNNVNREPGITSGHAEYWVYCLLQLESWDHGFQLHCGYSYMSGVFCVVSPCACRAFAFGLSPAKGVLKCRVLSSEISRCVVRWNQPQFRRNISPPSSRSKNNQSKKPAWKQVASNVSRASNQSGNKWLLVICFHAGFFFGLVSNPEDGGDMFLRHSFDFQQTTGRYILEDSTFHNHRCDNLKSYVGYKYYVFGYYPSSCLYLKTVLFIFKTLHFGDWIMSPSSGKTYSVGPNR